MKGQAVIAIIIFLAASIGITLFFGVIKGIQTSLKNAPAPPKVISHRDMQDQKDRMADIQRRQKDLMENQKQRMEDMRRMQQR